MSSPLPPLPSAAGGAALPLPGAPAVSVSAPAAVPGAAAPLPAAATGGAQPVPAAPPVPMSPPAPPATTNARWSAEMLQNLRLQAFEQLVAQLARQVQASPNAPAPQWPADGVSAALGRMLQTLLEQMGAQQGRPLQMLAAQPGSAALLQALAAANPPAPGAAASAPAVPAPAPSRIPAQGAAPAAPAAAIPASAPAPALAGLVATAKAAGIDALLAAGTAAAAATPAAAAAQAPRGAAPPATPGLPPLQNWWVQQGTLVTPQGERGFMLSLQVPQAWAQAQLAATALSGSAPMAQQAVAPQAGLPAVPLAAHAPLAAALMAGPAAAVGQASGAWRLPLDVPLQALASGPVAVVLQPRDEPQLRTSALLLLEFQPLRQAQVQAQALPAMPFTALSPAMAQEMQQLLQNRGDPWLQMAVAQNAGAVPRERSGHQSHLCNTAGCQYEGRAPCAQPFCSEMNRLWGVARAERRL